MICVIGDLHGNFNLIEQYSKIYDLKNTHIIVAGDCGFGFSTFKNDIKQLEYSNKNLKKLNNHIYFIRGNHDMPAYFMNNPQKFFDSVYNYPGKFGLNELMNIEDVEKIIDIKNSFSNIQFVEDYTILNIEEKNILCIGGAVSVDRSNGKRKIDSNYWIDEVVICDENVIDNSYNIMHIISHTAPNFVYPFGTVGIDDYLSVDLRLRTDLELERSLLTEIFHRLKKNNNIESWIYGHFHMSKNMMYDDTKFVLLNSGELYELR